MTFKRNTVGEVVIDATPDGRSCQSFGASVAPISGRNSPRHRDGKPTLLDAFAAFDHLPDSACVREPVVRALFQCSSATVWRWSNSDRLPRPLKLGPRLTVWNVGELRRVLAARSDERC